MAKKPKKQEEWILKWRNWVRPTSTPGLYELKDGGYMYRKSVTDPATGKERQIKKVMRDADETAALIEMRRAISDVKTQSAPSPLQKERFADYAVKLFEEKKKDGDFKSDASLDKWEDILAHLIAGSPPPPPAPKPSGRKRRLTKLEKSGRKVPGLGEYYVHMLEEPIKEWRRGIYGLIEAGLLKPKTANTWVSVLVVITKAMTAKYKLPRDPGAGFKRFDESEHPTFTEEQPNAIPPDRVGEFLDLIFEHFPQHYCMTYVGFLTGLRPSTMRPLRRRGPEADVKWEKKRLVIRQSQTRGNRIMGTTKERKHNTIDMPDEMMHTLVWHVQTQLRRPVEKASDLLFPSTKGSFRSRNVLTKPFNAVAEAMGLTFRFTTKGMRRTFQDLHRIIKISPFVTRSISGHRTVAMHELYSTVQNVEQRDALAQVLKLLGREAGESIDPRVQDAESASCTQAPCTQAGLANGAQPVHAPVHTHFQPVHAARPAGVSKKPTR